MSLKYIITGTGRCGTMFMSRFLTDMGIPCGHEVIFTNEGLTAAKANLVTYEGLNADSSYMAAPYLQHEILKNASVIHLVREPMKVINSFVVAFCYFLSGTLACKRNNKEWTYAYPPGADPEFKFMKFIYFNLPELHSPSLTAVERAAIHYIKWNEMIERGCAGKKFLFHRIESDISKLTKFIGIDKQDLYNDKDTNKAIYKNIYTLNDIRSDSIKEKLIDISKRYGYLCSRLQKLL